MVKLKEICDVDWGNTSLTKASYKADGKYLGVSAAGCDGRMDYYDFEAFTPVMSAIGANCGKMFLPQEPFVAIKNTITLRPHDDVDGRYLYYALVNNGIQKRGGSQPFIGKNDTEEYEIPLPSKVKQFEIVNTLEIISSVLNSRIRELRLMDTLVKARFVEMFGDFKTNPMGWPVVSFEEIAIIDGNMTTDYDRYADYPHIGIDCIERDTGRLKGYRTVAEDGVISGKYLFTPAHIIYSKIRPNLNKVALPDFEGLCSADAYPILPIVGKCNRIFLAYNMRSTFFLDYILQFCNRTNLPKVNRKEVAGFKTPLPPIQLQDQFATFVSYVEQIKCIVQKALDNAQLLFDRQMQVYFK